MARGRMLSQSIALDLEFNKMSMEAQFLFMRAVPHLDRDGLILGNPVALWAKIAPLMPDLMQKTESCIKEWRKAGLVVTYDSPYGAVIYFKGFTKNQANLRYDREADSMFPPPPGYYRNGNGLEPVTNKKDDGGEPQSSSPPDGGNVPPAPADELRHNSGMTPDELRHNSGLIEVKLSEVNTTQPRARDAIPKTENGGGGGGGLRQENQEFAEICTAIECNGFGMMTQILSDEVADLLKDYPSVWILDAMKIAVKANKRKINYVAGVLRKWRADGRDPPVAHQAQAPPAKVDYAIAGML